MKTAILERIYRRILSEAGAPDVSAYGAVVVEDADLRTASIYDLVSAEGVLRGWTTLDEGDGDELQAALEGTIVGYVEISEPKDPCWDAYKISGIIGPGKLVYGVAYALSPSGLIIPGRNDMTPQAVAAWKGMASKVTAGNSERKVLPCNGEGLREDEDALNYAYGGEGWETTALAGMERQHWALRKRFGRQGGTLLDDVLMSAGAKKFTDSILSQG